MAKGKRYRNNQKQFNTCLNVLNIFLNIVNNYISEFAHARTLVIRLASSSLKNIAKV